MSKAVDGWASPLMTDKIRRLGKTPVVDVEEKLDYEAFSQMFSWGGEEFEHS